MCWTQSIGRGRRFRRGQADWTSAASPPMASWRWPVRPCRVWFVEAPRDPGEILRPMLDVTASPFEGGRASAGGGDSLET